jgi:hypothetical protein
MWFDTMWGRGGRLRLAVALGLRWGLWMWIFFVVFSGRASIAGLLFATLYGTLLFGGTMAFVLWKRWPDARRLDPDDRVAIVRAVRRGTSVENERQARALLDYRMAFERATKRDERFAWTLFVYPILAVALLIGEVGWGSVRHAAVMLVVLVSWIVLLVRRPERRATRRRNAEEAERLARRLLSAGADPTETA